MDWSKYNAFVKDLYKKCDSNIQNCFLSFKKKWEKEKMLVFSIFFFSKCFCKHSLRVVGSWDCVVNCSKASFYHILLTVLKHLKSSFYDQHTQYPACLRKVHSWIREQKCRSYKILHSLTSFCFRIVNSLQMTKFRILQICRRQI